jgi:hypothetical protein
MKLHTLNCQLGLTSVTVVTNHRPVLDYLCSYYAVTDDEPSPGQWTIEALVGQPEPAMSINAWGVAYQAVSGARRVRLVATDSDSLAITTRKTVREAMVDLCEQRRYTMLHASTVADDHRAIIMVGDKGSGKTTLGLKAALLHGMRYISNDHLIVYGDTAGGPLSSRLVLTGLPTHIMLKIGTYLDIEAHLPPPLDAEGVDLDAYRAIPREQRYALERSVSYTFPGLNQESPASVHLGPTASGPAVLVVLAGYTDGGTGPVPLADPVDVLMAQVRTDWMFNRNGNQRHLPREERDPVEYADDARRLVSALAERATVIGWGHRGDPTELLTYPVRS